MIRPVVDPVLVALVGALALALVVAGALWASPGRRGPWLVRGLMALLLVLVALRPGVGTTPVPTRQVPLEVLVVVDRTTSMSAEDWYDRRPRLEGVRRDVETLVSTLPSGRFTVVTFGATAHTLLPSTQDVSFVTAAVGRLRRETVFGGTGSRLDRPLPTMRRTLTRMRRQFPDRPRIVVLMSDGEATADGPQRSFAPLDRLVDTGLVLGYGTSRGGQFRLDEDDPASGWVPDPATGDPAVSRLDEMNLRRIAGELGVGYLHRERPGGLEEVARSWEDAFADRGARAGEELPARYDLYWVAALGLFLLGLLELRRHWRRPR